MAYLAPAGTPVTLRDLAHGALGALRGPEGDDLLAARLRELAALPHAWPTSSGRAAMTVILQAMRATAEDSGRDEVVVPAYTCYSVPAAIERAGLRPRLCDIDPATLSLDADRLRAQDFSRVLAVVSSNLYGLPNDLAAIETICRERGVYFLDDAAQALGARVADRPVGAFGDAGIYSFDKGKIISTIQGGAIVCAPGALAARIAEQVVALPASRPTERAANFLKLGVYAVFLRPALYPLIRMLPFTGLGHTPYETRYPVTTLARFQSAVALRLLARLDQLAASRRRHAGLLQAALQSLPGIETFRSVSGSVAAYARYPVRIGAPDRRKDLIGALNRAGIGATASYPLCLADVPEVRARQRAGNTDYPAARRIASTIFTLPTHAYCPPDLAERVSMVIRACNR
jgi:perosamine synthetase